MAQELVLPGIRSGDRRYRSANQNGLQRLADDLHDDRNEKGKGAPKRTYRNAGACVYKFRAAVSRRIVRCDSVREEQPAVSHRRDKVDGRPVQSAFRRRTDYARGTRVLPFVREGIRPWREGRERR